MSVIVTVPTILDLLMLAHKARADEVQQYEVLSGEKWDAERVAIKAFNKSGVKYLVMETEENIPVVAGGYELQIPGVWESWMIGTPDNWTKYWRTITKCSRRVMDGLMESGARRLQTCVLATREQTCEWYVRGLKMQLEGTFRGFGVNGEAMKVYARVGS